MGATVSVCVLRNAGPLLDQDCCHRRERGKDDETPRMLTPRPYLIAADAPHQAWGATQSETNSPTGSPAILLTSARRSAAEQRARGAETPKPQAVKAKAEQVLQLQLPPAETPEPGARNISDASLGSATTFDSQGGSDAVDAVVDGVRPRPPPPSQAASAVRVQDALPAAQLGKGEATAVSGRTTQALPRLAPVLRQWMEKKEQQAAADADAAAGVAADADDPRQPQTPSITRSRSECLRMINQLNGAAPELRAKLIRQLTRILSTDDLIEAGLSQSDLDTVLSPGQQASPAPQPSSAARLRAGVG